MQSLRSSHEIQNIPIDGARNFIQRINSDADVYWICRIQDFVQQWTENAKGIQISDDDAHEPMSPNDHL